MSNKEKTTEIDAAIGGELRKIRIVSGHSRKDVARLLDLSVSQIQRYENGLSRISAVSLFRLAKYFKTDLLRVFDVITDSLDVQETDETDKDREA